MMELKPISTAPKDCLVRFGTLTWDKKKRRWEADTRSYRNWKPLKKQDGSFGEFVYDGWSRLPEPTYWFQLPEPPHA